MSTGPAGLSGVSDKRHIGKTSVCLPLAETLSSVTRFRSGRPFPEADDLHGAAVALVRLQDTYQLNMTQLPRGHITGLGPRPTGQLLRIGGKSRPSRAPPPPSSRKPCGECHPRNSYFQQIFIDTVQIFLFSKKMQKHGSKIEEKEKFGKIV